MIKLGNILSEVLNTFQVECDLFTDKDFNITDVLNQVRGLRKVTIVRNITPPEYVQKQNFEYTLVTMKFISRGEAKQDLENFEKQINKIN